MVIAFAAVLIISGPMSFLCGSVSGDDGTEKILFDSGNGETEWYDAISGSTYRDVLRNTAVSNGMTYSDSPDIVIDGTGPTTIGAADTGGSLTASGTTGATVDSEWTAYSWDPAGQKWDEIINLDAAYQSEHLALAFYPAGYMPVETPLHPSSWTMVRGDAQQTGHQDDVAVASHDARVDWAVARGGTSGVYSSVLYVEDLVFIKFGASRNLDAAVICYRPDTSGSPSGMMQWEFTYSGHESYETATPVIIGEYIFIQTADGYIYKMPWREGPGINDANVTVSSKIPEDTGAVLKGDSYGPGIGSMVYDSGALFLTAHNGMAYCFDLDLNLIWSSQMDGYTYYVSPTVSGDYLFTGARDGCLYVMDKTDGSIAVKEEVYTTALSGNIYGNVSAPAVFRNNDIYTIMFTASDGRGMNSVVGGIGVYRFNASSQHISKVSLDMTSFGLVSNYVLPVDNAEFTGIYVAASKGIFRIGTDGVNKLLNDELYLIKAPLILVNGISIYLPSYSSGKPIYEMDLNGKLLSSYTPETTVKNYCMAPVLFVNGMLFYVNDAGVVATSGAFPEHIVPVPDGGMPLWQILLFVAVLIAAALIAIYAFMRFVKKIDRPFGHIRGRMSDYVKSDQLKHNTKSRHRLLVVLIIGITLTVAAFIACLCIGPTINLSISEMFSSLFSAISKGGQGLDYNELMVYESRLPRTLAALGVGIGLSIAGSMYQAIIRNPLVDPYIMGVSAGAGTAAVAVIAFDFTLFGLFSSHSIYLTAFTAIIGGIIAFLATMFIAERAGGSSLNYVLSGVVIGLAFSAIQTLMLSMAGDNVSNALSWLFGSFANVTWSQVWLILIPAVALSMVPLIWAKEFNLVLLGEDQAQQMGLNVRRFNRIMLILASALTSICVAFVGIIGFVGLVVPHLCRMLLGGDHRLVLPASIAFGGLLMMVADLAARMLFYGQELPVGAITTIIGVPVFAYLLIKRGKLYEG